MLLSESTANLPMQNQFYLTEKLPPYIFAAMYKLKTEAAAKGVEILDFGMGNPDSAPPQFLKIFALLRDQLKSQGYMSEVFTFVYATHLIPNPIYNSIY